MQITFENIYTLGKVVFNKTIILVADGEDTPREMYVGQNYQYYGFKYQFQNVYENGLFRIS